MYWGKFLKCNSIFLFLLRTKIINNNNTFFFFFFFNDTYVGWLFGFMAFPQRTSPSDCLLSYLGHSLVVVGGGLTPRQRCSCIFYSPNRLGNDTNVFSQSIELLVNIHMLQTQTHIQRDRQKHTFIYNETKTQKHVHIHRDTHTYINKKIETQKHIHTERELTEPWLGKNCILSYWISLTSI